MSAPEPEWHSALQDHGRRTGRTTRMLAEAYVRFMDGERVVVLAHSLDYAKDLANRFQSMFDAPRKGQLVFFDSMRKGSVKFQSARNIEKLRGVDANYLIDHAVHDLIGFQDRVRLWDVLDACRPRWWKEHR